MTIQQLRYLTTVAECNSINKAAQKLFMTQSNLSKAIQQLENELGYTLIVRSTKGISFTSDGSAFLSDAYALLEQFDLLQVKHSNQNNAYELSISSQNYAFVVVALKQAVNNCKFDKYSFRIFEGNMCDVINDVASGRSHIGFIYYNNKNKHFVLNELLKHNLVFHEMKAFYPHVYLYKNHPLSSKKELRMEELEDYPFIYMNPGDPKNSVEEEIFPITLPEKNIIVSDRGTQLALILSTNGYTTGSGSYDKEAFPEIVTIPLASNDDYILNVGWIELINQKTRKDILDFIDICKKEV